MKVLLLALTLLANGFAWADWVQVASDDKVIFYIDPSTIRKEGNSRKIWELQDLKQSSKEGELSFRARVEYDCKQERSKIMFFSTHSGQMAWGNAIVNGPGDEVWQDVPPRSSSEIVLRLVCAL